MQKRIRFGVIGTGGMASAVNLPGLKNCSDADLAAICARSKEHAQEAAGKFGIASVWTDWREMLEKAELDAVAVCAPDDLHYEMTMAAVRRGLHVACEKPLAMNATQAREMLDAAEKAGVRHMTCYNWRLIPAFRYLQALVAEGYVGEVREVELRWPTSFLMDPAAYQWRYDSRHANGVLGDLGSHLIDLALWIAGPMKRVSAFLGVFGQMQGAAGEVVPRANDSANLLVEFENDAHGRIWTSATTHEPFAMTVGVGGSLGYLKATFALWGDIGMSLIGRKAAEEKAAALPIPPGYLEGFPPNVTMFDAAVALLRRHPLHGRVCQRDTDGAAVCAELPGRSGGDAGHRRGSRVIAHRARGQRQVAGRGIGWNCPRVCTRPSWLRWSGGPSLRWESERDHTVCRYLWME